MRNPRYQVLAIYEEGSNSVRKVPENYCLIAFDGENTPSFDIDAATTPYREFVERAWDNWVKSESSSKDTLAAFVSIALNICWPSCMRACRGCI